MKRIITTLLITFAVTSLVNAQQSTYVGLEAGLSKDIYKISETTLKELDSNGTSLKNARPSSIMYGITLRHDLNSKFYLETGVFSKTYYSAIGFKAGNDYSSYREFKSLIIPIKIGAKINLVKDFLQLSPSIGYTFVKNYIRDAQGGSGQGEGSYGAPNNFSYQHYHRSTHHTKSHSLLQAGMGLDLKISSNLMLSASANYYKGFNTVITNDISYKVNNEPARSAQLKSKGEMKTYNLGIKVKLPGMKCHAKKQLTSPVK